MASQKYGRTYHFPFSPGTTSEDKIQQDWLPILQHELVITEKLDGENTCLKTDGVYALALKKNNPNSVVISASLRLKNTLNEAYQVLYVRNR